MDSSVNINHSEIQKGKFNDFDINTGYIFSDLLNDWKDFDIEFLQTTVQEALQAVLLKNGIVTYQRKEPEDDYFFRVSKEYFEFKTIKDKFPLPEYFISLDKLIAYSQPVILLKEDNYFDLFFALKLRLIKPTKIRAFLSYQFKVSFDNNRPSFNIYLHDLLLSYSFLTLSAQQIVRDYLNNNLNISKEKFSEEILEENSEENLDEYTTQRQCLAVYYLLLQSGIIDSKTGNPMGDTFKADILKLISFLTTKNESNIKKRYNTMFGKGSEKAYLENLRFIRPYFEKLQLTTALEQINKSLEGATP